MLWNFVGVWYLACGLCPVTYIIYRAVLEEGLGTPATVICLKEAMSDVGKCLVAKLRRSGCQHLSCQWLAHSHLCEKGRGVETGLG